MAANDGKTRGFSPQRRGQLRGPFPRAVFVALSSPRELLSSILMKDDVTFPELEKISTELAF